MLAFIYRDFEARGVITRDARFRNNQQTTSYTLIVGYNAPCYGDDTADRAGMTQKSHRTRTSERDKDFLTGEAPLPDEPVLVFEDG